MQTNKHQPVSVVRFFLKEKSGVAIIEFAIIAPVLFLVLIGFMELSLIFFTNIVLEGATSIGSRIGKTGYSGIKISRENYIRSKVQQLSGGYLDVNKLDITILSYDNFNNIGKEEEFMDANGNGQYDEGESYTDTNGNGHWDADRGISGPGDRGAIVLYRISYPWEVFTPMMNYIIAGGTGIVNITTTATVRNERF